MLEDGARQRPEGGEGHGHLHGGLGALQAHQRLHHRLAQRVQQIVNIDRHVDRLVKALEKPLVEDVLARLPRVERLVVLASQYVGAGGTSAAGVAEKLSAAQASAGGAARRQTRKLHDSGGAPSGVEPVELRVARSCRDGFCALTAPRSM